MLGNFSFFCCCQLTFRNWFFQKILSGTKEFIQVMSVLIWTQTVCKGYQQMTEVAASKERVRKIFHIIWAATWDFQQCGMCDQQNLRSACAYAQSDQSLCWSQTYSMNIKLLTKQYLESRVLTRILKIGVKMLSAGKSWSFIILFYCDFWKSWSQNQKVGVK